jgi:hypothetical protein
MVTTVPGVTVTRRFMTPAKLAVLIVASALACYSAWGPNADRHHKSLIDLPSVGSVLGSDADLMMFSAELAILRRGNQDHASQHSNFVARAEWVGYRERK